jgi:hypothetical protein
MRYLIAILMLVACNGKPKQVVQDSVQLEIIDKGKFYDSVAVLIPIAEKKIKEKERVIIKNIYTLKSDADSLKKENESLKEIVRVTKSVIIRDTIYIKEKTNFWGKKKVTTDSIQSIDSTIVENEGN